jgi:succinate dehydrogenase / fumarate reductase membrane anchor subunit
VSSKSPLGRALGLGTASGTQHWWLQRVGSVALLPLCLWFAVSLLTLPDLDYATVHAWLARPLNAFLMLLLVPVAAQHSWLGVEVIVQDYMHREASKLLALLALEFLHVLTGLAACLAILKVFFGAAA